MAEQSRELDGVLGKMIRENEPVFLESVDIDNGVGVIGLLGREFALIPKAGDSKPKANPLTVKIDVDVSEALTGLKAVERQAKKATQAIRELETYYERDDKQYYVKWRQQGEDCTDIREVCMTDIPTVYLHRELMKRDGVTEYVIEAHKNRAVIEFFGEVGSAKVAVDGPARIIVNKD